MTDDRIPFIILVPVHSSFLEKEKTTPMLNLMLRYLDYVTHFSPLILLVKDLKHVNNSNSIFDFGYHFWSLLEVFKKCPYVFHFDFAEGFKLFE